MAFRESVEKHVPGAPDSLVEALTKIFDVNECNRPSMTELKDLFAEHWLEWTTALRAKKIQQIRKSVKQRRPRINSLVARPMCGPDWGNVFRRRALFALMTGFSLEGSISCMPTPRVAQSASDMRQAEMHRTEETV